MEGKKKPEETKELNVIQSLFFLQVGFVMLYLLNRTKLWTDGDLEND